MLVLWVCLRQCTDGAVAPAGLTCVRRRWLWLLQEIFAGNRAALAGIDILRKVCNHPDLLERAKWEATEVRGCA